MVEIRIYGEVIPFEDEMFTDGGGYVNLSSVQKQLATAKGEDIKVRIRSMGGDVQTGFDIYNELRRYAKDNDAKIETLGEGFVASIATIFFLAGDKRILTENTNPFLHNAWCYTVGDSKEISRTAVELETCNNKIAEHYALHTDLTKEEALQLMDNETSITPAEAKEMRFATDIEEVLRPVALKRFNTNIKSNTMNAKAKQILAKAAKALGLINNKLVATAAGSELDFYELADDAVVAVGDKAYYDGVDAEGDYIMPNDETYVFVAGELTEIVKPEEVVVDEETDLAEANATIKTLTEQLEAMTNKVTDLAASNKAKDETIASYKASSKPTPVNGKQAPRINTPTPEPTAVSQAVKQLNKIKTR
jgi:Protease subunit of ATP-dependent Clp proteases